MSIKIVITGNPTNVRLLSAQLKELHINFATVEHNFGDLVDKFTKVMWCDLVHIFSLEPCGKEGIIWTFILLFLKIMRKKVILHWIGTDVMAVGTVARWAFPRLVTKHLAYSPWLVDELETKNVNSTWLPVLPPLNADQYPLPKEFTVLVHLGGSTKRNEFYGSREFEKISKNLSSVSFLVVGRVAEKNKLTRPNVRYFGRLPYEEMDEIYRKSTVLLRLTVHDGLSLMVLEALSRGRYVVWSQEFPHCFKATDTSEATKYLRQLREVNEPNIVGYNFINDKFNNNKWLDKLMGVYKEVLDGSWE